MSKKNCNNDNTFIYYFNLEYAKRSEIFSNHTNVKMEGLKLATYQNVRIFQCLVICAKTEDCHSVNYSSLEASCELGTLYQSRRDVQRKPVAECWKSIWSCNIKIYHFAISLLVLIWYFGSVRICFLDFMWYSIRYWRGNHTVWFTAKLCCQ